jgi:hypothetical protein
MTFRFVQVTSKARLRPKASIVSCAFTVCLSIISATPVRADTVTDWNLQVFASGGPQIQRTLAMVHIAMFDAINAIEPRYTAFLSLPAPPPGASAEAAAASAAHGVLLRLFPARQATLALALAASLAAVPDGPGESSGVAFGDLVAAAIYQERLSDNILTPGPAYVPGTSPGDYQLTGPPPVNTGAPNWIPFALTSASQFRPNGPSNMSGPQYAADLEETRTWGGTASIRDADQEQIARWHTEQSPFQYNRVARMETATDGRGLFEHARFFALLNIAIADSITAVFEAKYFFNAWRPWTAINNADIDGNERTVADPAWTPFVPTPPHPEYPAAHGTAHAAPARILRAYFGPNYSFCTTSPTVPDAVRCYADADAFAAEARLARIYGGMHFRRSLEEGARQGWRVGNWVLETMLLPLD